MELSVLLRTVYDSRPDDWVAIPGPVAPQYLGEVISGERHWLEVMGHDNRHVLKSDVRISLAIGMATSVSRDEQLQFEGIAFPDRAILGRFADVQFNGQCVHREHLILVDGGRGYLPLPSFATMPSANSLTPEVIGYLASSQAVAIARLADALTGNRAFDTYLERSGIVELPDDDFGS